MPVEEYDALVFHESNLVHTPQDVPKWRKDNQLYVHHGVEAPFWSPYTRVSDEDQEYLDNFFNISLNYRQDADIRHTINLILINHQSLSLSIINLRLYQSFMLIFILRNTYVGKIVQTKDHPPAESLQLENIINQFAKENTRLATKPNYKVNGSIVAQFVSDCQTPGQR